MANNNLPKKLSLWDKVKLIFSGNLESLLRENSALREQVAAYEAKEANLTRRENAVSQSEAELKKQQASLAQQESDLNDREAQLERDKQALSRQKEKVEKFESDVKEMLAEAIRTQEEGERKIRDYKPIAQKEADTKAAYKIEDIQNSADTQIAQIRNEAAAEVASAKANADAAIKSSEESKAKYDKFLKDKVSAGEITAGKGEQGAAMTIFFEQQIIQATECLKADMSELESVGDNPETKEKFIANYQASLLGSLLAYMDFDNITNPETKKIIEAKVQKAIVSIVASHPETTRAFTKSYLVTKYQAYDGKFTVGNKTYPDLDSFIDSYASNQYYFTGEKTDFRDPVQIITGSVQLPLEGMPYSPTKETKYDPTSHFLPRTDFSSLEFRIDPNLKVPEKSDSERPASYSPDLLNAAKRITKAEGFEIDDL